MAVDKLNPPGVRAQGRNIQEANMIAETLNITCNNCASWFTEDEIRNYNEDPCPQCSGELLHAHEHNFQTPWMQMKAEMYHSEIDRLERRVDELKRKLINECWEE